MEATQLDRATAECLAAAPLTYPTVVGDQGGTPAGFASITRTADLGSVDFAATADALMGWQVRKGFAYGTLPGHPESGEESFTVEDDGGRVTLTICAFSRPASRLARAAGPVSRAVQRAITRRYLHALTVS